jgi:anti-anti-sigma factor
MPIVHEDVSDSFRRIALSGRLDGPGTAEIETRLAALATAAKRRVVVDMTGVSFLASIGIRAVLSTAKAAQQGCGRMVLYVGGNTAVTKTLEALLDTVRREVTAFAGREMLEDDCTLLAVRRSIQGNL